jgi:endonuclease YncB( thermonuclease family)
MKRKFCSLVLFVVAFSASADIIGRIVRVLDGDTVEVLEPGNQLTRIRLAGIDAPEKSALRPAFPSGTLIDGGPAACNRHRK